jgi:hypothetical protein
VVDTCYCIKHANASAMNQLPEMRALMFCMHQFVAVVVVVNATNRRSGILSM